MIFPVAVDVPMERWPWMNWAMMAALFFCFIIETANPDGAERFILGIDGYPPGQLSGDDWGFFEEAGIDEHPLSWVGHLFMHIDFLHLAGNLLFMWVFGNAVCAKIGNALYPVLWLACGLIASAVERLLVGAPLLGASGAISGLMGFYVVFYLHNDITMFFLYFLQPVTFSLSSYWVVGAYVALDLLGVLMAGEGIAYIAHLSGTATGFITAIVLLKVGFLEASQHERTLLHSLGSMQRSAPRGTPKDDVDHRLLMRRLQVHVGDGDVQPMLVAEMLNRARNDPAFHNSLVSEDGAAWSSFGQWLVAQKRAAS